MSSMAATSSVVLMKRCTVPGWLYAESIERRAVGIDVVGPGLRIVLDDEDHCVHTAA